ncbi:MAG: D-alanyl-lipoteichoic acid biosynthesis protein DltD [Oscillospiraceae bacterium]|jgi:D-alanine transfer protein|nr:D-alanyl-lipoteichoic acid biosynthesis protein DltD [Oscillospiraceae bacterium]
MLRRFFIGAAALVILSSVLLRGVYLYLSYSMPPYRGSVGSENHNQKITGLYLVKESAKRENSLIIYGSSELRTLEISTHPANFFKGGRSGFQVNLVGRGSCQALIHAISIAASGDSLTGKRVALITSPQSYAEEGIAPDMFMANFSPQQYLELIAAEDIPAEMKEYISARVETLFFRYENMAGVSPPDPAIKALASHAASPTPLSSALDVILTPYYALSRGLFDMKDLTLSARIIKSAEEDAPRQPPEEIDWAAEEETAIREAEAMTSSNGFGILDGYYAANIGERLSRLENRDKNLSYSVSEEYGDLRLLFEVCREKGIEPLFIHVPLHGAWSDYTGFLTERREEYYRNVNEIAKEYGIEVLDLTGREYDEYFLCDVMHLGWRGWLEVDRALIEYYYGG